MPKLALRHVLRIAGAAVTVLAFLSLPAAVSGCSGGGGGGDKVTAPTTNLCAEASFDSQVNIGFNMGCSTLNVSISAITYDQFSRRRSYNYDISCAGGTNRKTGSVTNITYNNIGQALTWDYTVNGTSCRKS
jgi:hypothetical protein